jgi:hypothetical protein
MNEKDSLLKKAFDTLENNSLPTESQKEIMLNRIMLEGENENSSCIEKLKRIVIVYPWRLAFVVSAVQAAAFTLIFGTQYTNLFLGVFGG